VLLLLRSSPARLHSNMDHGVEERGNDTVSNPLIHRSRTGVSNGILHLLLACCLLLLLHSPASSHANLTANSTAPSLLGPDCPYTNSSFRVGVFTCPSSNLLVCAIPRLDLLIGFWAKHVNQQRCGLLGNRYAVHLVVRPLSSSAANASEILAATNSMLSDDTQPDMSHDPTKKGVHAVMLPSGSNWANAMNVLEAHKIPAVAPLTPNSFLYQCAGPPSVANQPNCVTANTRRYQFAHSISSPGDKYLLEWIGLLQLAGAKTMIAVATALPLYQTVFRGLSVAASDAHMSIVGTYLNLPLLPGSNSVAASTVNSVVDSLVSINADAVAIMASDCRPWIHRLRAVNYLPKSLATILCTDSAAALAELGDDLNYVVGPAQWDPHLTGVEYEESNVTTPWGMFPIPQSALAVQTAEDALSLSTTGDTFSTSPWQFVSAYQATLNTTNLPGYDSASILAALSMLEGAIESAGAVDGPSVNRALQLYFSPSFFGLLTTDRYGMNQQKQLPILQRDSTQNLHVIAPSQFSSLDFIYPMPSWDERVYKHSMYALPVEISMFIISGGCMAFTLGLCVYLFNHRHQQIFQAAGVWFYMLMGAGCILSYLAPLTWPVENNATTCSARVWVWTMAFQMFVSPMVACAYRIARIYSVGLVSVRVSNTQVAAYCLLLATPQMIINILWSTLSPLEATLVSLDALRPAYSYTVCESHSAVGSTLWGALTLVYCGILLISACTLAWRVRKAYAIFNDAKPIVRVEEGGKVRD
jgi:hypothetical protein